MQHPRVCKMYLQTYIDVNVLFPGTNIRNVKVEVPLLHTRQFP
jgi:hypothetical protein